MGVAAAGFLGAMVVFTWYGGIPGSASDGGLINGQYYFNWHDETYTQVSKQTWQLAYVLEQLATDATVEWMIGELEQELDEADEVQDNYRFAVALVLCNADPALLVPRRAKILKAASFPTELEQTLAQVIESSSWDWATAWREFERLGQELSLSGNGARDGAV